MSWGNSSDFLDDDEWTETKVICRTCFAVVPWNHENDHLEWHRNLEIRIAD